MRIKIKAYCLTIAKDLSKGLSSNALYKGQRSNLFIDGQYFPAHIYDIVNQDVVAFDTTAELYIEIILNGSEELSHFLLEKKFELREANHLVAMAVVKELL